MVNPAFSHKVTDLRESDYVLPPGLAEFVINKNRGMDTGKELRLQEVYQIELWAKLRSLGLDKLNWHDKKVLDVCCGTGFLSYHLLSRVAPGEITLNDISGDELDMAKELMAPFQNKVKINYLRANILETEILDRSFDLIVGNSFLHHFYNVPFALKKLRHLLKPEGMLITLHEPTVAAVALESGSPRLLLSFLIKGQRYIDETRYKGNGIAPGGGADVWIFKKNGMADLLQDAGFENIIIKDWHFLRPLLVSKMALHLSEKKNRLNGVEEALLRASIFADSRLNRFVPSGAFGSFCFSAQRPSNG